MLSPENIKQRGRPPRSRVYVMSRVSCLLSPGCGGRTFHAAPIRSQSPRSAIDGDIDLIGATGHLFAQRGELAGEELRAFQSVLHLGDLAAGASPRQQRAIPDLAAPDL